MESEVTVRYWAGARRAAGLDSEHLRAATLGELLKTLGSRPKLTAILQASSVLVDGVAAQPDTILMAGATVDILPPFAGGR
ncbi:MoaD/ThiS family protein [Jatrophihabitans sp. DSM 45814]